MDINAVARNRWMRVLLVGAALVGAAGCTTTAPTSLLAVNGRTIVAGTVLALTFDAPTTGPITVSVQGSSDATNPDVFVALGDHDVLGDIPLGQFELRLETTTAGQEVGSYTPTATGRRTLFIDDLNDVADATFSVTVTQQ